MNRAIYEIITRTVEGSYSSELIHKGLKSGGEAAKAAELLSEMRKFEQRELERMCADLSPKLMYNVLEREINVRHRRLVARLENESSFSTGIENAEWAIEYFSK